MSPQLSPIELQLEFQSTRPSTSEDLKVAIGQLCNDVTGLQFHYVTADPKVAE